MPLLQSCPCSARRTSAKRGVRILDASSRLRCTLLQIIKAGICPRRPAELTLVPTFEIISPPALALLPPALYSSPLLQQLRENNWHTKNIPSAPYDLSIMQTALTRLLNVRLPIVSAPMAGAAGGALAAAVTRGGGFAFVAAVRRRQHIEVVEGKVGELS